MILNEVLATFGISVSSVYQLSQNDEKEIRKQLSGEVKNLMLRIIRKANATCLIEKVENCGSQILGLCSIGPECPDCRVAIAFLAELHAQANELQQTVTLKDASGTTGRTTIKGRKGAIKSIGQLLQRALLENFMVSVSPTFSSLKLDLARGKRASNGSRSAAYASVVTNHLGEAATSVAAQCKHAGSAQIMAEYFPIAASRFSQLHELAPMSPEAMTASATVEMMRQVADQELPDGFLLKQSVLDAYTGLLK
ncbi:hypothetical protein ACFL04_03710 [Patescibacteria group bacterium]